MRLTCKRYVRPLLLGLALAMVVAANAFGSTTPPTPLVPGNAQVAGRGYGQWVVTDYQWRLTQPNITSKTSCLTAGPSLSTSGETLTIEESMTLRARTENAGHVGVEHEWREGGG